MLFQENEVSKSMAFILKINETFSLVKYAMLFSGIICKELILNAARKPESELDSIFLHVENCYCSLGPVACDARCSSHLYYCHIWA